jgi:Tfp pilus assembly PilM family ATPase
VLSSDAQGSRVLVMAADRDYIRKRLDALDMAGIAVDSVDCNLSGTLNLGLLHEQLAGEKPATLWLDFAGTTATASIVVNGHVHTTRVFVSPYVSGASGAAPTAEQSKVALKQLEAQAADRALEAPKDEYVLLSAEEAGGSEPPPPPTLPVADTATAGLPKAASVNLGAQEVADRIRKMSRDELLKFVNRVAVEARRLLYMTRVEGGVPRLVVSGLGHEGPNLAAALANELRLEDSQAIDLMDSVVGKDRDGNPSVKVPDLGEITFLTGVALKGLGRDETEVDYRQGDLAAGTMFDYAKTPLAFTATAVFLFAGIMFLIAFTQVQTLQRETARLVAEPYDLQTSFVRSTKKAKKTDLTPKERTELLNYPMIEDDPAAEIQAVYSRMNEHQKRISGEVVTEHPIPHRADVIVSEIVRALQAGKPSYDFALIRIDVTQESASVTYFASTSETNEEIKARGGFREDIRMSDALKKLMSDKNEIFDGEPVPASGTARGVKNGDRTANEIRLNLKLQKVKEPVRAAASTAPKK